VVPFELLLSQLNDLFFLFPVFIVPSQFATAKKNMAKELAIF
jgi:hypothetical protein